MYVECVKEVYMYSNYYILHEKPNKQFDYI
jgi:hypothetical protein